MPPEPIPSPCPETVSGAPRLLLNGIDLGWGDRKLFVGRFPRPAFPNTQSALAPAALPRSRFGPVAQLDEVLPVRGYVWAGLEPARSNNKAVVVPNGLVGGGQGG